MFFQKAITGLGAMVLAGTGLWAVGLFSSSPGSASGDRSAPAPEKKAPPLVAKPLVAQAPQQQIPRVDPNQPLLRFLDEAIVIPECRLGVIDKTEISAQREGVLLFIGRKIQPGDAPDREDTYRIGPDKVGKYRQLKEGDIVEENDLLALVDDRLAVAEVDTKEKKLVNAKSELTFSEKTRDEAKERYATQLRLQRQRATNDEDVRAAKLAVEKYHYEVISKNAAIGVADSELKQTKIVVEYHEIRNKIPGRVQAIYKKKGEAVKNLEPVMLIRNLDRLRAEGMVDVKHLPRLQKGAKVFIEPAREVAHYAPFVGHTQAITGVAFSKDPDHLLIASSSEDGTVRIWKPNSPSEYRILYHWAGSSPVGVRCVAFTPPGAATNWCLTGANDGKLRLWDLDADSNEARELDGKHRRPVTCLTFNQDASLCASGGEDYEIRVWETANGRLKLRLTDHHGPIQSLQFTSQGQLVSTANDHTIMVWNIGDEPQPPVVTYPRRSDEVPVLGVSPDGKRVLFDPWQSKNLLVLTLPERRTVGEIRNPSGTAGFKTLALFSPDGKLVLTGSPTEGMLQLWNAPTESSRASEVRQLVSSERSTITCAAFYPHPPAPNRNGFVAAGTKDRQVLVWPLPSPQELDDFQIPGVVSFVERSLDASAHQVRIWADFQNPKDSQNPDGLLMPGGIVTVVVPPGK